MSWRRSDLRFLIWLVFVTLSCVAFLVLGVFFSYHRLEADLYALCEMQKYQWQWACDLKNALY